MQAYRNLLGESWESLPAGVRTALTSPLKAFGRLEIRKTRHGLAGVIGRLIPLPPTGQAVETRIEVRDIPNGVVWSRQFGAMKAVSKQILVGDRLSESAACYQLELKVFERNGSAVIEQTGLRMFGIPVPMWLGPLTHAILSAGLDDQSWHISVTIGHVWLGTICSYEGLLHAEQP